MLLCCSESIFEFFTREPRSVAESTSDYVVVLVESLAPQLAGNGLLYQPCFSLHDQVLHISSIII